MPVPAAARLVEFKLVATPEPQRSGIQTFPRPKPPAEAAAEREAARVAEAFLRGKYEGLDSARVEYERKLAEAEAAFEERLAVQRALWVSEQGTAFAARIDNAFDSLGNDVGDAVAAILAPFLEGSLRARIVEELLRTLAKVLKGGKPASLKITGPDDLLDSIRRALGDSAAAIEFEATGDVDVRVVADSTVIETQLEAWLQRISGRGA